jgi:cytochrome c biogenesis protein CcdA
LIVSFFLTPCTGGPYFVAGGILSKTNFIQAIPYLLLYMIIFISPMIAITLIVYFGFMAVEDISGWREKNIKNLHWIAGLILLGLGIAMLFGLI